MRTPDILRAAVLATAALTCFAAPAPIRTLILSGRNNHEWRFTTPALRQLLSSTGRFDVRVTEEPASLTPAILTSYDLLILDYNGARWSPAAEAAVAGFVQSGKGLVAVHGASYAFGDLEILDDHHRRTGRREPPWPDYAAMLGASWSDHEPKSGHGNRHIFSFRFTDRDHPITRGLQENFRLSDELYHNLRLRPDARVLATALDDTAFGGTGKNEPILWTVAYGKGRVFYTALGHDLDAIQEPGFVLTFLRGAEWAASAAVTLPAIWPPQPAPNALRVLVVTGGHDHEASFYNIFEGRRDLTVTINPHPIAYRRELVKSYDVLVLYDTIQDLPEQQMANLRAFVESGKGVVALHHSIADFWNQPWWYKEVIGGRYLIQADGPEPASTFLHDQELDVVPATQHPILKGIAPIHIWDETYKKMWISPDAKILLTTNHPTSDGPVAWISPYTKSRVVFIQLGHGRPAHEHPAYRQLVYNAIQWAGGRLR